MSLSVRRYAKTWLAELLKRHKELLRLKREKEELMQQVLDSGNIEGYVQLKTKDMIHGGTFEMVGSSAEMARIAKEKGYPGCAHTLFVVRLLSI